MYLPNEILQVCFDIHEKVKTPSEGQEEILRLFGVGQGEQLSDFIHWIAENNMMESNKTFDEIIKDYLIR